MRWRFGRTLNQFNWVWWMGLPTDPLSHAGLSVAAVFALHHLLRHLSQHFSGNGGTPGERFAGPVNLSRGGRWHIDYRLVIIGALLPDLIDKSLQLWFFPEVFHLPGRSFAHTMVFNSILVTGSLLLIPFCRSLGPLIFALTSAGHLLLDRMWESPVTLLWPLFGLSFGRAEFKLSPWWLDWAQSGVGPKLLDLTGALVLLIFALVMYRRRTLLKWIKIGLVS